MHRPFGILIPLFFSYHCSMPDTDSKQSPSAASFSADQLRRRYIIALSLIALLTVVSQLVVQFLISDQEYDSRVINIAGRQRMLSQKITKTSLYVANAQFAEPAEVAAAYRRQLDDILALWERSHLGLQRGDSELGLPGKNSLEVSALFLRIEPHHRAIVTATKHLLVASAQKQSIDQDIRTIRNNEPVFLQGMDEIVFRYDLEAKHKVVIARWLELGLMVLTLLVLALEAMFIFAPVTRRIRADMRTLEKKEEDMSDLFAANPSAMLLVDVKEQVIVKANQKAADLLEIPEEQLAKSPLRSYIDPKLEPNRLFYEKIAHKERLDDYEIVLLAVKGSVINALVSVRELQFSGRDVFVLGITNISELKKAHLTLEHFATFDEMTGLINRRTGLMLLTNEMARSRRDHRQLTICFADLDGLKTTNDRYGHAEGDWMLRTTADVLNKSIRAGDIAVRMGGDEFLLIFHDCLAADASQLLARVEDRMAAIRIQENKPFAMGLSYGVTAFDATRHSTPEELIAEADSLMYKAKQERKKQSARTADLMKS